MMTAPTFDDQDQAICDERFAAWNKLRGPRIGDFAIMPDGRALRFAHDWGKDHGVQTTDGEGNGNGSFYLGKGYAEYSGGLDRAIPHERIERIDGEYRDGWFWFFHHNHRTAHNGVRVQLPCRVFRIKSEIEAIQDAEEDAYPQTDEKWGSHRQIEAENEFFRLVTAYLQRSPARLANVEGYYAKATAEERIAFAIAACRDEHEARQIKKCTNAEPGTFNHECGKPATWEAKTKGGNTTHFCDDCKEDGWEARLCTQFVRL